MKGISLLWNVALTIGLVILFVLHFSAGNTQADSGDGSDSLYVEKTPAKLAADVPITKAQGEAVIVYVNIDTLLENYAYYRDVSTVIEKNLAAMDNAFKQKVMNYQTELQDYMSRAEKGLIPKESAIQIEEKLMKDKQAIENEEKFLVQKQEKEARRLEAVQKKLYDFFKEFVAQRNYSCVLTYTAKGEGALGIRDELDVTKEVLTILNDDYKKKPKGK